MGSAATPAWAATVAPTWSATVAATTAVAATMAFVPGNTSPFTIMSFMATTSRPVATSAAGFCMTPGMTSTAMSWTARAATGAGTTALKQYGTLFR